MGGDSPRENQQATPSHPIHEVLAGGALRAYPQVPPDGPGRSYGVPHRPPRRRTDQKRVRHLQAYDAGVFGHCHKIEQRLIPQAGVHQPLGCQVAAGVREGQRLGDVPSRLQSVRLDPLVDNLHRGSHEQLQQNILLHAQTEEDPAFSLAFVGRDHVESEVVPSAQR